MMLIFTRVFIRANGKEIGGSSYVGTGRGMEFSAQVTQTVQLKHSVPNLLKYY